MSTKVNHSLPTLDIVASMDYLSAYLVSQKKIAPVAQWIERQPPELEVAGSNPAGRTTNKIDNLGANLKLAFFMFRQNLGRNIV